MINYKEKILNKIFKNNLKKFNKKKKKKLNIYQRMKNKKKKLKFQI
jgi:hypothetical protein